MKHYLHSKAICLMIGCSIVFGCTALVDSGNSKGKTYYLSATGNDSSDGSRSSPWKTLARANRLSLQPGDSILLEAGQSFNGTLLLDSADSGTPENPVVLSTWGTGKAIIDAKDTVAVSITGTGFLQLSNLSLRGSGRKQGNTTNGLLLAYATGCVLDGIDITGFQKAGLCIYSSNRITAERIVAVENGACGIFIAGEKEKNDCRDILLRYCRAENNPGDPTNFTNHSGNGILAGLCRNVTIEYCTATNNGWDMPRKGNGPVGIWCYEADSVTIQYCISYRNKTSPGSADGGGYDFDGGVTNSVIQYCLSYENEGSAFGIFQYAGASNWYNNTVRYCISENDGSVSAAHAGVFIWNSSMDTNQFRDFYFYNNTIYNEKGAAISYEPLSANAGFHFWNNIFVGKDSLILGEETNSDYRGNNWYSLTKGFSAEGFNDFNRWATEKKKEMLNGTVIGLNVDPSFNKAGNTVLTNPDSMEKFDSYQLPAGSSLRNGGLSLDKLFGIKNGGKTFNKREAPQAGIGAIF